MKRLAAAFALATFASVGYAADEDKDLDLIPKASPVPATPEAALPRAEGGSQRVYVENALSFATHLDDLLVPPPPPLPPLWQERLFLDARLEWPLASNAHAVYSGRLNVLTGDGIDGLSRSNLNLDLRELYASVEPWTRTYLDVGRVNVKSGVALGFNPTDFFKARAVIDPLTADPRALREDRLGTLVVGGQWLGEGGSISAAYAPDVAKPDSLFPDPDRFLNPLFGRTNYSDRVLVKASAQVTDGFNPEVLLFRDKGRVSAGLNLTETIGQSVVVYGEWAGGRRLGLIDEALAFGRDVGDIPAAAPSVISQGNELRFRSQAAIGASYTTESKLTLNLEYHYNGAGFSKDDWDHWFAAGSGRPASSPIARELWYIRAYASDRQEPLAVHGVFLRGDWVDFMIPKLELTGFVLADAGDGSAVMQLTADYAWSDHWSFGVLAGGTAGGRRSNFGSLPQGTNVLFKATRYF